MGCSGGLLSAHGLFNQAYDDHQNAPADAAGSDLTDNRGDIKASAPGHICSASEELPDNLRSHAAPDDAGDRVADSS